MSLAGSVYHFLEFGGIWQSEALKLKSQLLVALPF